MSDATVPVIVTAYFFPRPGAHDQVVAALKPAIAGVHEEDGCELYAIHDAPDGTIVMLEKWTSVELLDAHGGGEPVRKLGLALDGLLERPVEVTRLVPLPTGDAAKGAL
jgi:quinol monooxygenase YgiN